MTFIDLIREAQGQRLLIGGHKGHLSKIRENTIPNFEEVLLDGVDYIEIDVQLTKDHIAVIYHDRSLETQTQLSGNIRDYTVSELKSAFDLCTLEEAIQWCKKNHVYVLLEVKGYDLMSEEEKSILALRIADCLKRNHSVEQCIVLGIDYSLLKRVKQYEPDIGIALIVPQVPSDPVSLMQEFGAIIYLSYIRDLNAQLVRELHEAGIIVDGSIVNSEESLKQALAMGIDMIESDYPKEIIDLYQKRAGN